MKLNVKTIRELVEDEERLDDRELDEYREINLETDYIPTTAQGSAKVSLGNTQVIAGVSVSVEEPYPDRPDSGTLVTNAELAPMADREFESGPPQEKGVELARVVDRGIRESEAINQEKLCIKSGEKVYTVFVDLHILNNDGNLIDACSLAAIAALKTGYIPEYDEETETLNHEEKGMDIPLEDDVVTTTGGKIKDKLIWDPTKEEEEAMDARLTVSVSETGNVVSMQKGGTEPITQEEINKVIDQTEHMTTTFREILDQEVEN